MPYPRAGPDFDWLLFFFFGPVVAPFPFAVPLKLLSATLLRAPSLFAGHERKLVRSYFSIRERNSCFSVLRPNERARRKMVMRKSAVGWDTFWSPAENTWDLRHAVGIKLSDLGGRSHAQKVTRGNNQCGTNLSWWSSASEMCWRLREDVFNPTCICVEEILPGFRFQFYIFKRFQEKRRLEHPHVSENITSHYYSEKMRKKNVLPWETRFLSEFINEFFFQRKRICATKSKKQIR